MWKRLLEARATWRDGIWTCTIGLMMNASEAKQHAAANIVPEPIVTVRGGLPCVGTRNMPGFEAGAEVLVTAQTYEEAFAEFGRVCPPAYLPISVEAYADTPWREVLEARLARERAAAGS